MDNQNPGSSDPNQGGTGPAPTDPTGLGGGVPTPGADPSQGGFGSTPTPTVPEPTPSVPEPAPTIPPAQPMVDPNAPAPTPMPEPQVGGDGGQGGTGGTDPNAGGQPGGAPGV